MKILWKGKNLFILITDLPYINNIIPGIFLISCDPCFLYRVSEKELNIMMRNVDHLLVLFHDRKKASQKALSALEDIDDDCDDLGISFVEVVSNCAHIVIHILF